MMQAAPIPSAPVSEVIDKQPLLDAAQPTAPKPEPQSELLQELSSVDRLLITKRLRVKSVIFLRGKKNRFLVRTPDQTLVYTIEEDNSWWVGYFCYGLRPLQLRVTNSRGAEVMRIDRPYACTSRLLPCQLQALRVYSPPADRIGSVEQVWAPVRPIYLVKNNSGDELFRIKGPRVTLSCFWDIQFRITRPDGSPVGATCKRWQGLAHALFYAPVTDSVSFTTCMQDFIMRDIDNGFGVAFDAHLTVEEKALLLAATLLLDYMYYDT